MQNHRMSGMDVAQPVENAVTVVNVETPMLMPTSSMQSTMRSILSLLGSVLEYAPVIMNVSSEIREGQDCEVIYKDRSPKAKLQKIQAKIFNLPSPMPTMT